MKLTDIQVGKRHRQDLGDIQALADNIREVGLLHPLVVSSDNVLIAGQRRLEALKLLGWEYADVRCVEVSDLLKAEWSENEMRKDFTHSERVAIGRLLRPLIAQQAKERKTSTLHQGAAAPVVKTLPNGEKGRTRDIIGKAVGVSGPTYEAAELVVRAAEEDPSLAPIVEEMDRTGKVHTAYDKVLAAKQGRTPPRVDKGERDQRVIALAQQSYRVETIAREVDMSVANVRKILAVNGERTVTQKIGKHHRIDANKVIDNLLSSTDVSEDVLGVLRAHWDDLDTERFEEWATRLTGIIAKLRQLRAQLRRNLQ